MTAPFEWMMALRYLRAKRQEGFISVISWFSLIGIALGVATLIVVMSVMNGFRQELFQRVMGLNGHMNVYAMQGNIDLVDPLAAKLAQVKGVTEVTPTIEGQVLISRDGVASGAYVRGLPPEAIRRRATIADHIVEGSLATFEGNSIAIGLRMAQRLNVKVGDTLTLISPVGAKTIFGSAPRMRGYTIGAIFNVGMYEYDSGFIFMPLKTAQVFFKTGEAVTSLEMFVDDPENVRRFRPDVVAAIGPTYPQPLRLLDWQQSNASFFTALQVERNVMFLILTMIILVAAFNIISGLIMLVKDKGRDIAILRTMGATRAMVMRIFFLNGSMIGVGGTLVGLALGLFVAHHVEELRQVVQFLTNTDPFSPEVYFLTHMPSVVDASDVTHVVLMALSLSFLATLYPSWRAAKQDPVEALRYE